jgi:hypothetical protein
LKYSKFQSLGSSSTLTIDAASILAYTPGAVVGR